MIYLDNNATTPLDPVVLNEMLPFFTTTFANPASNDHSAGASARTALEAARLEIANCVQADPREIIFTSGATEACNLALKGCFAQYAPKGKHMIIAATEHKAVLDSAKSLARQGADVTYLPVDHHGIINLQLLEESIRQDTILVAVMWANNETGVVQPMDAIGEICSNKGTLLFSDATQAVGKISVDPRTSGVQMMAFNGHKVHGPKGIGALYFSAKSPKLRIAPMIDGGGHESGFRSGTVNMPGVIGLASALRLAVKAMQPNYEAMRQLRDDFEERCVQQLGARVNGTTRHRMPHVSNMQLAGINAHKLLQILGDRVAIATGSACTSADPQPSHVLHAMGLTTSQAESALRISFSRMNTRDEADRAFELLKAAFNAYLRN